MKRLTTLLFSTLLLCGCGQTAQKNQAKNENKKTANKTESARPANIVKKHINVPSNFSYITNLGSVDIYYRQGEYNIEVEGDSLTLTHLVADFDSGVLTVSTRLDNYSDINRYGNTSNIKMYVSTPELKCVSICANGGFEALSPIQTNDLQLGVIGTGHLKFDKVRCTTISLQSNNSGPIVIKQLYAEDVTLLSRSNATISLGLDVNNLVVMNEAKQKITLTGKAQNVAIKNPTDQNLKNLLEQ